MSIGQWLAHATKQLQVAGIATARLDALILLSDTLVQDKNWLLAHADEQLDPQAQQLLNALLLRRQQREPLAYIRGKQAFFGHTFSVTPDVLIPRPETETLLELLLAIPDLPGKTLIDVGTGSGCIAISAKQSAPRLHCIGLDISPSALRIARQNATQLGANVDFKESDLLQNYCGPADIIAANLPYVDSSWHRSPETNYEPLQALFAGDSGLALIKQLFLQATALQTSGDRLFLEADPRQHQTILGAAQAYQLEETQGFILQLRRL